MDNTYQTVYITLNDGTIGQFCGPTLVKQDEPNTFITDVRFSQPKILPAHYTWEILDGVNHSNTE